MGNDGDDRLWGKQGNDFLLGGPGHDWGNGGPGVNKALGLDRAFNIER
jgi:Ca2+-binding RTX toxin-like protein